MASHILDRLKERYGLDLALSDVRGWQRQIEAGRAVMLRRDVAAAGERYLVTHAGMQLILVYNTEARRIVTVLPLNQRHAGRKQAAAGPGKTKSHRNGRRTRYIPAVDLGDEAA